MSVWLEIVLCPIQDFAPVVFRQMNNVILSDTLYQLLLNFACVPVATWVLPVDWLYIHHIAELWLKCPQERPSCALCQAMTSTAPHKPLKVMFLSTTQWMPYPVWKHCYTVLFCNHQTTKGINTFWKNGVHPSSIVWEIWRINTRA